VRLAVALTVYASDLAATRAFYADVLGMAITELAPDAIEARRGDVLIRIDGGAEKRKRGRKWMQEAGLYLTIETDDFAKLHADLTKRGASFLGEVTVDADGRRFTGLHDPDGVLIEIVEAGG
jgi:catechol 2,3-dioxygenase-like lactoylglutathione lyase family enzyme